VCVCVCVCYAHTHIICTKQVDICVHCLHEQVGIHGTNVSNMWQGDEGKRICVCTHSFKICRSNKHPQSRMDSDYPHVRMYLSMYVCTYVYEYHPCSACMWILSHVSIDCALEQLCAWVLWNAWFSHILTVTYVRTHPDVYHTLSKIRRSQCTENFIFLLK
jgi:hypothetical protein